jgi:hypothetical protein
MADMSNHLNRLDAMSWEKDIKSRNHVIFTKVVKIARLRPAFSALPLVGFLGQ